MYLVSREGARIILNQTLPMYNTGDKMVSKLISKQILKGYLTYPDFFNLNQNRQSEGAFKSNLNNHGSLQSCENNRPNPNIPKKGTSSTHQILHNKQRDTFY